MLGNFWAVLRVWAGLGCLFRKNEELKGSKRLATCKLGVVVLSGK